MARLWYGGASADFVVAQGDEVDVYALDSTPPHSPVATEDQGTAVLLPLVGTTFDVYTDAALTVLTTSLLNASGGAITDVTSETDFEVRGTIPRFQGPNNHEGPLWLSVDAVTGYRLEPESSPLYARVAAVEADIAIAQTDISDATIDLGLLDGRIDAIEAIAEPVFDKFIADGTWVKPSGARKVFIECLGGGGGGGGCAATAAGQAAEGGGGGGGGFVQRWLNADDLPATVPVFVGAGGDTPGSNQPGGKGGESSFGSPTGLQRYLYASGGDGGAAGPAATGSNTFAAGGSGYSGSADLLSQSTYPIVITVGGDGGHGAIFGSTNLRMNSGGSSRFRGDRLNNTNFDSISGQVGLTGGGGSGARNAGVESARTGGDGGAGFVQVTTFF